MSNYVDLYSHADQPDPVLVYLRPRYERLTPLDLQHSAGKVRLRPRVSLGIWIRT